MDPCTHRVPIAHLSRLTGAPVLSVRYRLAPQNPFPAALVDALTAYLSLIHPPPGSLHDPVPANKIIISGDSAGGNLSLVLLQTLLTLRRARSQSASTAPISPSSSQQAWPPSHPGAISRTPCRPSCTTPNTTTSRAPRKCPRIPLTKRPSRVLHSHPMRSGPHPRRA